MTFNNKLINDNKHDDNDDEDGIIDDSRDLVLRCFCIRGSIL